ncbi:MAG TPA: helix-turn-helix transcriptional regulator [Rhizobacter sp.]|nr:helix-turn-helix transcriptional regulator [Rhizobacter sp.]
MPALPAPHTLPLPEAGQDGDTRDNSYVLGHHGFIYTGSQLASGVTVRHPAVLLLSADYAPFRLSLREGATLHAAAVLVAPLVARSLDARGVPLLSLNILPSHPAFHVFRAMQHPGAVALDRHAFKPLDEDMAAVHRGTVTIEQAENLFEAVVAEAGHQLPPAPAPDPRALELIRRLDANPHLSLDDLARQFGYSQQVMSRLFSSAVGMSVRDYHNWLKQRRVYDVLYTPRSLTQVAYSAGFADSPQFSRTFQRWYGLTPSFARNPKAVRVFIHGGSNEPHTPGG